MRALNEWESKVLLGDVPKPREALTGSLTEALAFSASVPGPVVAKAVGLAHKSERAAVVLDADLSGCWQRLAELGDGSVLVAEQVRGELELIAGAVRDAQFGPVLTIGLGGVAAEVFRDVAFLLSPMEPGELEKATASLVSAPLFRGWRGRPPVNLGALGSILTAIGELLEADPKVSEVDVNPILIRDGQPLVLDALVVKSDE
ncbi:MAG: acetate--CoA ligase family protein [Candidatus Dormibacteraeota bacterium]|nr:acetate--CoA ligase family protein [Candidatus Dormibacteraeota bacterium]